MFAAKHTRISSFLFSKFFSSLLSSSFSILGWEGAPSPLPDLHVEVQHAGATSLF